MGGILDWFGGKSSSNNQTSEINKLKEELSAIKIKVDSISAQPTETVVNVDTDALGYVTPQMFGAKANGYTDDTDAVQAALDSGKSVFFPHGTYLTSEPIIINDKSHWNLYALDAAIIYTGSDYAFYFKNGMNCNLEIGFIHAKNGGGIQFYADGETCWNQYITLTFLAIECKTDCIRAEIINDGWSNENRVFGGRFMGGENGVHIHHTGENYTNGWKFYNCGIEGVTNGFLFDAGQGYINSMVIVAPRYEESYETILKTIGFVFDCMWLGTSVIKQNELVCSAKTSRFEIFAPIRTIWDGTLIRHRGCIIDGKLMGEKVEYVEST